MAWKALNSFSDSMKGKLVRFKTGVSASNLSNQFNINNSHPASINIPAGALGIIYQVRGATLFIGFGRDSKLPPSRNGSPTYYAATIQFYLDDINKLEIEY